jgi:hypothetical protein
MSIRQAILDSHQREEKKVVHWVQRKVPGAQKEEILAELRSLPHDIYRVSKGEHTRHYYVPIFTPFQGGYQMDLLQQSAGGTTHFPAYFFIAINVNTRYGYAYPVSHKDTQSVLAVLSHWYSEAVPRVVHVSADQEGAWRSHEADEWFRERKITVNLVDHQRHSALGMIDRFIRTLRDMNVRTHDSKHEPGDRRFRDFSVKKMAKLVGIYNQSLHSGIGMTPEEMNRDPESEKEYIVGKVYETERIKRIKDFELAPGTWVRFMVPRNPMQKRRHQWSQEVARVSMKEKGSYVCAAADGSIKKIPRWQLKPVREEGLPVLPTWENNFGRIEAVIGGPKISAESGAQIWKTVWARATPYPLPEWHLTRVIEGQPGGQRLLQQWIKEKKNLRRVDRIVAEKNGRYEVKWGPETEEHNTLETEETVLMYDGGPEALEAYKENPVDEPAPTRPEVRHRGRPRGHREIPDVPPRRSGRHTGEITSKKWDGSRTRASSS